MASVRRDISLQISADNSDAVRSIDQIESQLQDLKAPAINAFDEDSLRQLESAARSRVGVLGDVDTALQTLGSVTGTAGLQIAGDMFAMGEAIGQLQGVIPGLKASFGTLGLAMGAAGLALGGLLLAFNEIKSGVEELKQSIRSDLDARRSAQVEAMNLTQEEINQKRQANIERIALEKQFLEEDKAIREQVWNELVQKLGDAGARVAIQSYGEIITEDDIQKREQYIRSLEIENDVLDKTTPAVDDLSQSIEGIADSADNVARDIETTTRTNRAYSDSVKYVNLNTELATKYAERYAERLGGAAKGMALGADIFAAGGNFKIAEEQKKAQDEMVEQNKQAYDQQIKDQQKALENMQRDRQKQLEDQKRNIEDQLQSIADFERDRYNIEQSYRDATFDATLNNDVLSFLRAGRERQRSLEQATQGLEVGTINVNMGEIASPTDIANAQQALVNALSQVMSQQQGTF